MERTSCCEIQTLTVWLWSDDEVLGRGYSIPRWVSLSYCEERGCTGRTVVMGSKVGKGCNLPTDTVFVKLDFLPWLAQYTVFNEIETFL
jgi:hypothetical protein